MTLALAAALIAPLAGAPARAAETTVPVEAITTPMGLEAWMVREESVPVIVVEAAFPHGSARDPAGREGLAVFTAALLDEGAGPHDSLAFRTLLEDNSIGLSFSADRDATYVTLTTLPTNVDLATELLALALTKARFDAEPISRIRSQLLVQIARAEEDPAQRASLLFFKSLFGDHPYGRPTIGTAQSIAAITPADLKAFAADMLTREGLKISVVGNLEAEAVAALIDATFGQLPAGAPRPSIPEAELRNLGEVVVDLADNPQTVAYVGTRGIKRDDPDFVPAFVMNYMLGGGGFASRLMEEVREKRGLAYSVSSGLVALKHAGVLIARVGTENASAAESLRLIAAEFARMGEAGVGEEELEGAKLYLTGSYPLRFDSNAKIARELLDIQIDDLGIGYINVRNELIEAVTQEDIARVARRLLADPALLVVAVGRPEGLSPTR
ncbi:MAG: insulinase family protein [Alphaproteobacteria bacterium]|nr:insulinase family protein [Alphaproteobacteria bacterium]